MYEVHPSKITVLGETVFRDQKRRFGLLAPDRLRHVWTMGKSGVGKSTLLLSLIAQDLCKGQGIAVIDPHGELVQAALRRVPRQRINDVLLLDPSDTAFPVSFNLFRQGNAPHARKALVTSHLILCFKKLFATWGPRLEHLMRHAILAVSYHPQANLVLMYRFLTDPRTREKVLEHVKDPLCKRVWEHEFKSYGSRLQGEALAPLLNRLGALLGNPILRNILGQTRSRINFSEIMNRRRIVLINLRTGLIGEDAAQFLGSVILSSIMLAALARTSPEPPFFAYIDEFQVFASRSIETILSESRKFGLGLTMGHQFVAQLPESLRDAMLGNVASTVFFRMGAQDAAQLEQEVAPIYTAQDLVDLPAHHIIARVTANGTALRPFTARTLLPPPEAADAGLITARIKQQSRNRYANTKAAVTRNIHATLS